MGTVSWEVSNLVHGSPRTTFNTFGIPRAMLPGTGIRDGMVLGLRIRGPGINWSGEARISSGKEVRLRRLQQEALRRAMRGLRREGLWRFTLNFTGRGRNAPPQRTNRRRSANDLTPGAIYTRDDLRALFRIRDATLNNGVFPFPPRNEIWLFVTETKPPDRTQYRDVLSGDRLRWQGQTAGRTDHLIIGHAEHGKRLLVFYRRHKYEFAGAGFRFEGEFAYERHRNSRPTSFTLRRIGARRALPDDRGDDEPFNPRNVPDGREKILRSIRVRRGQQKFRALLLQAYNEKCAVTGCTVLAVLEAAHISPYMGTATNKVTNGLLLRADLHTLFDSGLIVVDPDTRTILLDPTLMQSEYRTLHGKKIRPAEGQRQQPSRAALLAHRDKGLLEID
jgi:putative restriction endonuclease